jgi:hypothetical protein
MRNISKNSFIEALEARTDDVYVRILQDVSSLDYIRCEDLKVPIHFISTSFRTRRTKFYWAVKLSHFRTYNVSCRIGPCIRNIWIKLIFWNVVPSRLLQITHKQAQLQLFYVRTHCSWTGTYYMYNRIICARLYFDDSLIIF